MKILLDSFGIFRFGNDEQELIILIIFIVVVVLVVSWINKGAKMLKYPGIWVNGNNKIKIEETGEYYLIVFNETEKWEAEYKKGSLVGTSSGKVINYEDGFITYQGDKYRKK